MAGQTGGHDHANFGVLKNSGFLLNWMWCNARVQTLGEKAFAQVFRSGWAHSETAQKRSLRLSPTPARLKPLEADYDKMQEMFFSDRPDFTEVICVIGKWQHGFNQAGSSPATTGSHAGRPLPDQRMEYTGGRLQSRYSPPRPKHEPAMVAAGAHSVTMQELPHRRPPRTHRQSLRAVQGRTWLYPRRHAGGNPRRGL